MEGVALRWRAATVVLILVTTFLISGISALTCHNYLIKTLTSPHKGNLTWHMKLGSGITNCSSAENVCTDVQLKLTIDKEILLISYKGCARKDLKGGTESFNTGDRHFAIQFDESYCQGDLCNAITKMREDSKNPIGDKEASGSHQCYAGFSSGDESLIRQTMTCGKGYDRCYKGRKNFTTTLVPEVYSRVSIIFKTCQRQACNVLESQSFGPINITTDSEFCCSSSNCNGKEAGFSFNEINSTAPFNHPHDQNEDGEDNVVRPRTDGSGVQGLSLQLCPLLAALGVSVLGIRW